MNIISIVLMIIAVALIIAILLQQRGDSSGFLGAGGGGGGGGGGEFYQKRRGFEKIIFKVTILLMIAFALLAIGNLFINRAPQTSTTDTDSSHQGEGLEVINADTENTEPAIEEDQSSPDDLEL